MTGRKPNLNQAMQEVVSDLIELQQAMSSGNTDRILAIAAKLCVDAPRLEQTSSNQGAPSSERLEELAQEAKRLAGVNAAIARSALRINAAIVSALLGAGAYDHRGQTAGGESTSFSVTA